MNEDEPVEVTYRGVYVAGPESFTCMVLDWPGTGRVLPIWIDTAQAVTLNAVNEGTGQRRPGSHEIIESLLSGFGGPDPSIHISSCWQGVFNAEIHTGLDDPDAEYATIDARASDGVLLAVTANYPIYVNRSVLVAQSVYLGDAPTESLFDGSLDATAAEREFPIQEIVSASGDAEADADFEQLMQSLGVSEADLLGSADATDSTVDAPIGGGEGGGLGCQDAAGEKKPSKSPTDGNDNDVTGGGDVTDVKDGE
ncbi:bifunctional nuclease family protein [Corynebacterium sp. CCM 9185]|uniref:Bifunctional nuclease family protein n=1 Tax=Corynebacterium marambiense TaxID=2765364 RepID=A0ABS0VUG2_9CORY|nr:bifunctional nuclease family protein [Corynebacterium marambiense]MBI9000390.1 bifunctional nuclease family protein [Corynebacterium marambiense]MCK7664140.1 bifunctional nuclease family protein [Corynebacterium marambiense]MCX7543553.1 bifunctional nuclease family protein [Corynebacterium marambiense]